MSQLEEKNKLTTKSNDKFEDKCKRLITNMAKAEDKHDAQFEQLIARIGKATERFDSMRTKLDITNSVPEPLRQNGRKL